MRLLALLLGLIVLITAGLALSLPTWLWPVALIAVFFGSRWVFRQTIALPARLEGRVLRDAHVRIDEIHRSHIPGYVPGLDDEEEAADPRRYFEVELTIEPSTEGAWKPRSLAVVDVDATLDALSATSESSEAPVGEICDVEIEQDGDFVYDEVPWISGPVRVRLTLGVEPHVRELALVYRLERLATIEIPE